MTEYTSDEICEKCLKNKALCVCTEAEPFDNKHFVLIMQHPQEEDKELGTAGILKSMLKNAKLEVALSRPSLRGIFKCDDESKINPKKWGTLYLGAQNETPQEAGLYALSRKGHIEEKSADILKSLDGLIVLDGTWKQAKALWWRNAWLLKTHRLVLVPHARSLYGKMRKEPRKESISTLEAIAQCLTYLGEDPAIENGLTDAFKQMLDKYKKLRAAR